MSTIFSPTLSIIPFTSHDDGNRLGMASNFIRQSLTLVVRELPYTSTPYLKNIVDQSLFLIRAAEKGTVLFVDNHVIIWLEGDKLKTFRFPNSLWQPVANVNIKKGDIICQHHSIVDNRFAYGRNLKVLFAPYKGWNYEDAIVLTESGMKKLTTKSIVEYEILIEPNHIITNFPQVGKHYERGTELLSYIEAPKKNLVNIINLGSQKFHTSAKQAGIVEKIITFYNPQSLKKHQSSKQVLDWIVKHSLETEAKKIEDFMSSIDVDYKKHLKQRFPENYELTANKDAILVKIYLQSVKQFEVGDKLANRHGNKGVCSIIIPDNEVRANDGWIPDIILNPLGVVSRMNIGQIIEMHIAEIIRRVQLDVQNLLSKGKNDEAQKLIQELSKDLNANLVSLNSFSFEIPIYEKFPRDRVLNLCKKYNVPPTKTYEFVSGYPSEYGYGSMYWMPLVHTAEAKISYRADGPYSTKSLQPISDENTANGQRLGEMEIWALFAYEAYNNMKETLGYKADDLLAKQSYIAHTLNAGIPPTSPDLIYTNHLLNLYLHALSLDMDKSQVISEAELSKLDPNLLNIAIDETE